VDVAFTAARAPRATSTSTASKRAGWIDPGGVVKNIVTALNSSINFAPSFWIDEKNGNHYFIGAQYREDNIQSINTILDIPVTGKDQPTPVALRRVAKFSRGTAYSEINHLNITRVTDVFVNVQGATLARSHATSSVTSTIFKNDRAQVPEAIPSRCAAK